MYKWEFDKGDESLAIAVNGSLLLDELDLVIQAALDGAGLAWVAERPDHGTPRERSAGARAGGLVSAVSGLLSLLSEPPAAARRAGGADRYASTGEIAVSDRTTLEGLTQLAPTTIVRIAINGWQHATYQIGYS